jgi:tRNA G10  N-methylase Trm11
LRKSGRSVRLVPNQTAALNSAQVLHNHLAGENGCEVVLVRDGNKTICAETVAEQDIESYTLRDRGRPKRDARVGMLPPKLAQIIINLAVGAQKPGGDFAILDPFCGTGVVLQEALLMGFGAYGTDLEPRMIDYTGENLDWLDANFPLSKVNARFEDGDATSHLWEPQPNAIACETYLGQPYTAQPPADKLAANIRTCNTILEKFLANIGGQLRPGTSLCLAVPAWQTTQGKFKHLPLIDRLIDLGYNRLRFEHVRDEQLLYYREDQIVARELLVLTKQ